ncbi:DUF6503 family protein [Flavobacterium sp. SM2513]|uniref:DUF6503 family protein n=1 Tax=Flavobacterium sp. SM2513 TaxID=3424766 RepID=UPI003D7FBD27
MKKIALAFSVLILTLVGCKTEEKELGFTEKVEKAHHLEAFAAKEAIQFDFNLVFGGKERMDAKLTLLTNSTKSVIEFKDGTKIIADGSKVYYSPTLANEEAVRFDAYTWSYFFLFPYKLSDPGTIWNPYTSTEKDQANYLTEKLTFSSGTGDAPDDWYVVYADAKTHLLEKAAYIVTVRGDIEKANENPHAIQYLNYKEVEGIPIATQWAFWGWKEGTGLTEQIGKGSLSTIQFVTVNADTFTPGADFKTK